MTGKGKQLLLSIVDTVPAACHDAIKPYFLCSAEIIPFPHHNRSGRDIHRRPHDFGIGILCQILNVRMTLECISRGTCLLGYAVNTPNKVNLYGRWKRKSVKMIWVDSSQL